MVFYASALMGAFPRVLVAIVAGAAAGTRTSHWKRGLIGALVRAAFGIILDAVSFFLISLLQSPLESFAIYFSAIFLSVAVVAVAGLAVGLLERRSTAIVRWCVIVAVAFGLVLGIANAAVRPVWEKVFILALAPEGITPVSAVLIGAATLIGGAIVDLRLPSLPSGSSAAHGPPRRLRLPPEPAHHPEKTALSIAGTEKRRASLNRKTGVAAAAGAPGATIAPIRRQATRSNDYHQ